MAKIPDVSPELQTITLTINYHDTENVTPVKSSFSTLALNGSTLSVNGTDYNLSLAQTVEATDSSPSSFKGVAAVDNGDGTISLTVGENSVVVEKYEVASFATDSWATIAANIKSGNDTYSVGNVKEDTLTIGGTTYTCHWEIVDDTVGRYVTQSGQSHKVIQLQEVVGSDASNGIAWNSSSSATSFNNCTLKSTLNSTILAFLSADLQAVLETTTVYSGPGTATATTANRVASTSKLFIVSMTELYGSNESYGFANNTEGTPQYTLYSSLGVTSSNYSSLVKNCVTISKSQSWWTRSPHDRSSRTGRGYVITVGVGGSHGYGSAEYSSVWCAPCFAW